MFLLIYFSYCVSDGLNIINEAYSFNKKLEKSIFDLQLQNKLLKEFGKNSGDKEYQELFKEVYSHIDNNYKIIAVNIFFLLAELFLILKLLFPKKCKFSFLNYKRSFHPFFINELGENKLLIWSVYFILIVFAASSFAFFDYGLKYPYINLVLFFSLLFTAYMIFERNQVLKSFPIEFMKNNRSSLRIVVVYEDYINHKIADDEPHLKVNQFLKAIKKEYPRTSEEKRTIEIRNYETPANPALVTKIVDFGLSKIIDDGYDLKVRVVAIKDFGELEIEMWLDNIHKK